MVLTAFWVAGFRRFFGLVLAFGCSALGAGDWPMWGFDAARSGGSFTGLPDELHLHWVRELPPPRRAWPRQLDDKDKLEFDLSYSPVVLGDRLFVASMSTDSVSAYSVDSGEELWRYYADGPFRVAPAAWEGRIYAASDDGCLHCLAAEDGRLLWKFAARPTDHRVLGNERVVSMWPARGGPVVLDGTVYFAAGVWPFVGTFVFALDAETGATVWANTGHATEWQRQPHVGAYAFAGLSPQGYLAVAGDRLVVSGGRALPALFDRRDGTLLHSLVDGKDVGGYQVRISGDYYVNHGRRYRLADGAAAGRDAGHEDQVSDHVHVPHHEALNPGEGSYSFELWVRLDRDFDGGDGWDLAVAKRRPNGYYIGAYRGRGWNFMLRDDQGVRIDTQSDRAIPEVYDRWVFVQAVLDRDEDRQVLRVYDPQEKTWQEAVRTPPPGPIGTGDNLYFGMDVDAGRFQASGELGAVRFWRKARTMADAEADMARPLGGDEDGLAAYWSFAEGGGTRLADRTGGGNHGRIVGTRWQRLADDPPGGPFSLAFNERPVDQRLAALEEQIDGDIFEMLKARSRLFVVTDRGTLYCFGAEARETRTHAWRPVPPALRMDAVGLRAEELLGGTGQLGGYALFLGVGDGDLLEQTALRSDLHIVGMDPDVERIARLRRRFDAAGLHGSRIALIPGDPATAHYPRHISSLVVMEDPAVLGGEPEGDFLDRVLGWLRPYDGRAFLRLPAPVAGFAPEAARAEWMGDELRLFREGPLPGAGEWTHQHANAAQTVNSGDRIVRAPFGPIWFGGSSNHAVLPRHGTGPRPQVAGGRLLMLGTDSILARDVFTGRELWRRSLPGIGHPFTNLDLEERWADGASVFMHSQPRTGATYIGSPIVSLADSVYLRRRGRVLRLDAATGGTLAEWPLPAKNNDGEGDWGHLSVSGDWLVATTDPHIFREGNLGAGTDDRWDGTSSARLAVLDRHTGRTAWTRDAAVGFRHNAIAAAAGRLFVNDLLTDQALEMARRRGLEPAEGPRLYALDLATGEVVWSVESEVFGTFLSYCSEHDILVEGGIRSALAANPDEPVSRILARRGRDGEVLWQLAGRYDGPLIIRGDTLMTGRPGPALCLLTGIRKQRQHPISGESVDWSYWKAYGCGMANAGEHVLLFRSGAAGFADLAGDGGTGTLGGFRSGCTASMIPADGILNAPDYTRTCTCSYQNQTSMGLVHMPELEMWTVNVPIRRRPPAIARLGINFGAPGDRRAADGTLWTPWPPSGAPAPDLDVRLRDARFADAAVRVVAATSSDAASRLEGPAPSATLDGESATGWRITSDRNGRFGQWLAYALERPTTIDHLEVAWQGPQGTEFHIETSLDGTEWSLAWEETGQGSGREPEIYRFAPVEVRHIRLRFGEHGDARTDSRGRRPLPLDVFSVRIGGLADPDAYAYFRHRPFRRHALLVDGAEGLPWVAASGVRDARRFELHGVEGGDRPYTVVLHIADPDGAAVGERLFDIRIQGRLLATGFDPVREAGGPDRALAKAFSDISVGDSLIVELEPSAGSRMLPVLCGIELLRQ